MPSTYLMNKWHAQISDLSSGASQRDQVLGDDILFTEHTNTIFVAKSDIDERTTCFLHHKTITQTIVL